MLQLIYIAIRRERLRQERKWGKQRHPGLPPVAHRMHKASTACTVVGVVGADEARDLCERAVEAGTLSWAQILTEEVAETFEAVYEGDARKTRAELIQVAAVAVAWIEQLDEQLAECEGGSK